VVYHIGKFREEPRYLHVQKQARATECPRVVNHDHVTAMCPCPENKVELDDDGAVFKASSSVQASVVAVKKPQHVAVVRKEPRVRRQHVTGVTLEENNVLVCRLPGGKFGPGSRRKVWVELQ
jgi:hypothetical protein